MVMEMLTGTAGQKPHIGFRGASITVIYPKELVVAAVKEPMLL